MPDKSDDPHGRRRFAQLHETHHRQIQCYFRRRVDAADVGDLTAETMTIAWKRLDDVPKDALPWLYATARRVAANHHARARRRQRAPSGETRAADVSDVADTALDRQAALRALAALAEGDAEVLRLVVWEGLVR